MPVLKQEFETLNVRLGKTSDDRIHCFWARRGLIQQVLEQRR